MPACDTSEVPTLRPIVLFHALRAASRAAPNDANLKKILMKNNKELSRVRSHAVERFSETFFSQLEAHMAEGYQGGFYRYLKGIDVEGRKPRSSQQQHIRDGKGTLLRDVELIRARWVEWFYTLLSTKSPHPNPAIIDQFRDYQ